MKAIIIGILALAGLVAMAEKAGASTGASSRRKVTAKSGRVWFVATDPGQDPGSVTLTVFQDATSTAPILEYRQVIETGERFLIFQSPSTLGAAAKADFI